MSWRRPAGVSIAERRRRAEELKKRLDETPLVTSRPISLKEEGTREGAWKEWLRFARDVLQIDDASQPCLDLCMDKEDAKNTMVVFLEDHYHGPVISQQLLCGTANPQRVLDPIDHGLLEGGDVGEAGEDLKGEEYQAEGGGSGRAGKALDVGGDDESMANKEPYDPFFWYDSTKFLKRRAVEGQWDAVRGLFHFRDEDGQAVYVEKHMTIYDEGFEGWGYFYGNKWVPAHLDRRVAGELSTRKDKRRQMQ
ncbi:hypothetical protein B0H67DRAFT_640539 [Lasiosphaeris hirsuta]|uniref:Uncharacterized protein n=1 Tax=Lasiosphaeris hirsuta TaxID=260670 RepID=A0AA40E8J5_9PEZI|nr:hypothetical protein B0H67DRAFT_640539 [Lasiosphaeris hirsuta]